tara:strand:+ start:59768 stop:60190 length:423 start_codon:yes stop_codon:yes gene_type:complete
MSTSARQKKANQSKHTQQNAKQEQENLTVKFAGLEYECANEQEADDLRLCVSRAENQLRDAALVRAQSETPNFSEGQEEKSLAIENAKYNNYSFQATSDPQVMAPIVMNELRNLEKERRREELEVDNSMNDVDYDMDYAM